MAFLRRNKKQGGAARASRVSRTPKSAAKSRMPSIVAGVTVPVVLATLAIANPGVTISEVELNDGTVWVTNTTDLKVGRFNAKVKELNGGVVTTSSSFDVLQYESDVIAVEPATVSKIDPATMSYTSIAQVPSQSTVAMNGGIVSIADPTGKIWVAPVDALDTISDATPVSLDLSDGSVTSVDEAGTVYAFDPGTGEVHTLVYESGAAVEQSVNTLKGANGIALGENPSDAPVLTTVGTTPVVLANGTLYTEKATIPLLEYGGQPALQTSGPTRGEVLVATDTSLLAVNVNNGDVTTLISSANGRPARPVFLNNCLYSAWSASERNYATLCGDKVTGGQAADSSLQTIDDITALSDLVFRVNRDQIVLNDTLAGRVWLPENMPSSEDPNWDDIEAPESQNNAKDDSEEQKLEQSDTSQCTTSDKAPRARDDEYGVRADRTTILYVLTNDSAGQCGIIAITEIEQLEKQFGNVQVIDNGRALQVEVMPSATGDATFTYTITDGRGQNPPSTATVTLKVHSDSVNEAPQELRSSSVDVEQGATVSYNVLANFEDPDGDQLILTNATLEGSTGAVRYRLDGMVTFVADSQDSGSRKVKVEVSDGTDTTEATLTVNVRNSGTLAPTVNPIYRVTYVSSEIDVDVLSSIKSRSSEPVRLAAVDELAGTTIDADLDAGTFRFSAPTPGSYYVTFTLVSSPHTITGLARIDVREIPSERQDPVAVSDVALLPNGGDVTIDPLINDQDPNGGVMVLTGVELEDNSTLSVGVIEHRFVKIESRVALTEPETIHYTLDNGYATARGTILVQPVEPSTEQRAPSVKPVTVSVRTGGAITIPVLDYASDADGDDITLVSELPSPLPESDGLLFVSGNVLRYQATNTPGTIETTFVVQDQAGNQTTGRLTINVHTSSPDTKAAPKPKRITTRAYAGEKIRIPIQLTGIDQDGDGVTLLGQGDVLPSQGIVTAVGADWIEYSAFGTGRGTDTFSYAVEDWTGQRAIGTIRVGIVEKPSDALPIVATDDEVTVQPGTTVAVRVTRNDVDPSGLALTVDDLPELDGISASVEDNQIIVEVPQDGPDSYVIPYTVRNEAGGVGTAVVRVNVSDKATIQPPTVDDIVVAPTEVADKTSVEVDVFAVTENPSGTPDELDLSIPASHAEVAAVSSRGKITVQLTESAQTIPFKLTNPSAPDTAYTYAFIMVPALGDFAPVLRPKARSLVTSSGQEIKISLAEFVQVGTGKTPIIRDASTVKSAQSNGASLVVDEGTLSFTSQKEFHGTAAISFEVWDSTSDAGKYSILTIPITVRPAKELPPMFSPTVLQLPQGNEVVNVDLNQFAKPADGMERGDYMYAVTAQPAYGVTASVNQSTLTVSAPSNATRGTRGEISLSLTYGVASKLSVVVPFEIVASTKQRPAVKNHEVTANAGEPVVVSALEGAVDPVGEGLQIVGAKVLTSGTGTATVSGSKITITPTEGFAGTMKVSYTVTDALNDPNRNVDGQIAVTVRKEPDAPNAPRPANPSNKSISLSWDAPAANGTPVLDYRVTARPGGKTTVCPTTSCEITGLTNGTAYSFTVAARNEVGYSAESAWSSEITPDILPEAPSAPTTEFGDRQMKVNWTAPANEGSAIVRYTLEISPGIGGEGVTERSVNGTSTTIAGLKNGTAYTVRVRAINSALTEGGAGPWSPLSEKTIPAGVPETPKVNVTLPSDTPLGRQINVSWSVSSENGDPIMSYQVLVYSGSSLLSTRKIDASTTKWTFTDADNGVDYKFQVIAKNKAGESAPGTSDLISSFTAPSAPRPKSSEVVPERSYSQGGAVKYSWDAPLETGGKGIKISYYEVKDQSGQISGTQFTKEDITPGQQSADYSVRACNSRGACSDWATLAGTTAITKPQSPTIARAAAESYETYQFTITPRATGGTTSASYEYRINDGAWTATTDMTVTGTVTDFGAATSKDVILEARATNSQGSSSTASSTVTVMKPQPPTAPTNATFRMHEEWPDHVVGTWQAATSRGIAIDKYAYCILRLGTETTCGTSGYANEGTIFYVKATDSLKTTNIWVERGYTYELRIWAMGKDSGGKWVNGSVSKTTLSVPGSEPTPDPSASSSSTTSTAPTGAG